MDQKLKGMIILVLVVLVIGVGVVVTLSAYNIIPNYFVSEDATWHHVETFTQSDIKPGESLGFKVKGSQMKIVIEAAIDPEKMAINQEDEYLRENPPRIHLELLEEREAADGYSVNYLPIRTLEYKFFNSSSIKTEMIKDNAYLFGWGEDRYKIRIGYTSYRSANWTAKIYDYY